MDQLEGKTSPALSKSTVEDEALYWSEGAERAESLGNRGRLRFDDAGELASDILEAYNRTGFYVFEQLIDSEELSEFDTDLQELLRRAPAEAGSETDREGQPALGDGANPQFLWAPALSDPWGGTELLNGRHPVAMNGPSISPQTKAETIFLILGLFQHMPSALRLSAHPQLLKVAEALNGPDFVPYNDTIFLKEPGLGAAVAWHQDGTTHWERPDWHPEIHGFNFMAQFYPTTPANALWLVPGSHKDGRINIPELVQANAGSTRLPDAVPMLCERGDVVVCNRQCLHGSFANASPHRRATFVWGFFRRDAVLDVEVEIPATRAGQESGRRQYSADLIQSRSQLVQWAIEARHSHRPTETSYIYQPFLGQPRQLDSAASLKAALHRYNEGTIFI